MIIFTDLVICAIIPIIDILIYSFNIISKYNLRTVNSLSTGTLVIYISLYPTT